MSINVTMKLAPELDPGFLPAALWNREYRKLVAAAGDKAVRLAVCLERANGTVSRFDTAILPEEESNDALNLRYVERIVKFLLWARGGWKVTIGGSAKIAAGLARLYSADGERVFDHKVMGRTIYDRDFTVESCAYDAAPAGKEISVKLGGHFDGCRIGFDLGGSDRKCAAVKDGETVHSEEVVWDPYFQKDINYHRDGIIDSLKRAAAKLPRIDAIGGSAAGVYVDNQPRIASFVRDEASLKNFTAMLYFEKGTTLIYAGQEFEDDHLPSLFEREPIDRKTGHDLSAYLRRLYDVKQRFGDSDYFWAKADDAHQIAILERGGDKGRFLGVFSLRALAADVAVDAPDGCYVNLIDDENVEIRGGKLFCDGRPIILALG